MKPIHFSILFCFHSACHRVEQMNELLTRVARQHLEHELNALACLRIPFALFASFLTMLHTIIWTIGELAE